MDFITVGVSQVLILAAILLLWGLVLASLFATRKELLLSTWNEPYLNELAVLIESDDWGPGDDYHAKRLDGLLTILERHTDSLDRPDVLTADMILAVPDTTEIRAGGFTRYERRSLNDGFDVILTAVQSGIAKGVLVPQLHGLEHLYGTGLVKLGRTDDQRVAKAFETDAWSDWESLESPLQAHYVDGSQLPTTPLQKAERYELITRASETFNRLFGMPSLSTVAPCYLWDDEIEQIWSEHGIRYIQTAGYRCPGRDTAGHYIQDLPLIRPGQRNRYGQIYLVRNAMYEPVDGRGVEDCFGEARRAHRQGLPVVISTHRYNFTRSEAEYKDSLAGLDHLLDRLEAYDLSLRYLSSPELGAWLAGESNPLTGPATGKIWPPLTRQRGLQKLRSFLLRLWYRHRKLRVLAIASGLILPLGLIAMPGRLIFRRSA
jgi:hypothetical protein